jgi:hypothetical protein
MRVDHATENVIKHRFRDKLLDQGFFGSPALLGFCPLMSPAAIYSRGGRGGSEMVRPLARVKHPDNAIPVGDPVGAIRGQFGDVDSMIVAHYVKCNEKTLQADESDDGWLPMRRPKNGVLVRSAKTGAKLRVKQERSRRREEETLEKGKSTRSLRGT